MDYEKERWEEIFQEQYWLKQMLRRMRTIATGMQVYFDMESIFAREGLEQPLELGLYKEFVPVIAKMIDHCEAKIICPAPWARPKWLRKFQWSGELTEDDLAKFWGIVGKVCILRSAERIVEKARRQDKSRNQP